MQRVQRVPISVVILTKNEEEKISGCIKSVMQCADETIVVDDESKDGTRELAERLGAKVVSRRMDIEGRHRNFAYGLAKNAWVLSLDANGEIPGCGAMGTSAAVVTNTTVQPEDTNAFVLDTYLLPSMLTIPPIDTVVDTDTTCAAASLAQSDFSADPTTGIVALPVQFTDQSNGTVTEWLWDFGDGDTSTEQNPFHLYDVAGQYTVSLTTSGPDGLDTEAKPNFIDVLHAAAFVGSPVSGTAPLTVFFTDQSLGFPTSFLWA